MLGEWNRQINSEIRHVVDVIWNDPILTLLGKDWSFNTLSPWRMTKGGAILGGFDDPTINELLSSLVGHRVQGKIGISGIDPIIYCENGLELELFVTQTLEPWTYRDPGGTVVGP